MRVFISWSKEPSRTVAEALRDWLPDVIQTLEPWMSSTDIGAGTRWSAKVAEALASTKIGILCITPDNQREAWLLFEAGALAKTLDDTFVCPYLIKMRAADLAPGPLTQFQAKLADHEGTFELLSTVNSALGTEALSVDRLRRLFDRSWPDLERKLNALPTSSSSVHRPQDDVLTEILDTVRSLARRMPLAPPSLSRRVVPPLSEDERRDLERRLREPLIELSSLDPLELDARLRRLHDGELLLLYESLRHPERSGYILDKLEAAAGRFIPPLSAPHTTVPQGTPDSPPEATGRASGA